MISLKYDESGNYYHCIGAKEENLEAVEVAVVTESPRLVLVWRGNEIVNISRAFLDTNGAHQETTVEVEIPAKKDSLFVKEEVTERKCSQC